MSPQRSCTELDAEGNTTFVNPAFLQLFQADSPKMFIDRPFPPEELRIKPLETCVFNAKEVLDADNVASLTLQTLTGERLSTRLYLYPIKDHSGNIIGKRGCIWNLTGDPVA